MILLIHQTGLDLGLRRQIAVDGMELFAITGHVFELHLECFSEDEYYASGATAYYGEYLEKSAFRGKISDSLLNLMNLKYLDLSNNNFGGIPFPKFLGSMRSLRHLNLDTTGFGGIIPYQLGNLSNLQYLSIRGFLLGCYVENFHWLTGMVSLEFLDFNLVNLSQASDWLNMINTLPSLVELHISYCRLPNVSPLLEVNFLSLSILDLSGLRYLNLSHNLLTGRIRTNIGNMGSLESIDCSQNHLFGEIPQSFAKLTFLNLLNLSFNNLSGRIPLSTEILGFSSSSFMGNEGLCGPPLTKNCSGDGEIPSTNSERGNKDDGHQVNWFYVSVALGFVVGFWATFGPLVFNRRWRYIIFSFSRESVG
ncbi:hypothetical protein JCGZ_06581 [Jatropha curcas]|uniref:Uncharacterized protein n=1 Tax=Jatropha curcas TaxID=180498 RepID=A0A067LMM4_JATCU|nr:hypothetical protein JCGZ_06581 [Jatropha curcas]